MGAIDGTPNNAVNLGSAGALVGYPDTAIAPNDDAYISMGAVYDFAGVAPFSVEAWVFPGGFNGSTRRVAVGMADPTQGAGLAPGWAMYGNIVNNNFLFRRAGQVVFAALATDAWSHVVGTYDGTDLRLYVDGALANGPAASGALAAGTDFRIGLFLGSADRSIPVDEVAIYDAAHDLATIEDHYAKGSGS
jgi:hypothetical protein